MAKKGDILVKLYQEFPEYLKAYRLRLEEHERAFLHAKNDYQSYVSEIDTEFMEKENKLTSDFLGTELQHITRIKDIDQEFSERFAMLDNDIFTHNQNTSSMIEKEDDTFQEILSQFEERKAEAFSTYMNLTQETNYMIDREMRVHHDFIEDERQKLESKKNDYQELNSNLSNQLIWTMEKAKNALNKLSSTLLDEGNRNREFLAEVINESLTHLSTSRDAMSALFKTTSDKFDKERNLVRNISKEKRKPHYEINQRMIQTFVKQIRDVNVNRVSFEKMIRQEMELSLSQLYPKIISADSNNKEDELKKLILQKEIIEKKADYLLKRNQTMSDLLISKYQSEIKKIKIDSFKRSEEIKLAYSVPAAFYQNSINVYSNFAFYLKETYDELSQILTRFKDFNKQYIDYKENYIHTSQKTFEDYKINLLVKVNNLTNHLSEYIAKIDQLSHDIVTLESNNRLEIAEIRKKMENLEVFGDYKKYIASLENDLFFAMFQHNKNLEKIQIESNYTNNLFNINKEVLLLNQSKLEFEEYQEYMLKVAEHEKIIHVVSKERKIAEAKALFRQKADQILALNHIAHERIIHHAKHQNFEHAACYVRYLKHTDDNNNVGSEKIVDFIHHAQDLIDLNTDQSKQIQNYLNTTDDNYAYVRALETNRDELLKQVDKTTSKKSKLSITALDLYQEEVSSTLDEINHVFNRYGLLLKQDLIKLESVETEPLDIINHNGYKEELLSAFDFINEHLMVLAYKYQLPAVVKSLESQIEKQLETFVIRQMSIFRRIERRKNPLKHLKTYLVESINQFNHYQIYCQDTLSSILEECTKNDRKLVRNIELRSEKTKKVINKEYDALEFLALKMNKSRKKQLLHLEAHTERLNQVYKDQVSTINREFMKEVGLSQAIAKDMANKFYRIIKKNDKELNQMLKFLDKLSAKEKAELDKQYKRFEKSLVHIETFNQQSYDAEVAYVKNLYVTKNADATKTIALLEDKINHLPVEKNNYYLETKKERYALEQTKKKELQKQLAEIEKDKFISRPRLLEEIENVKRRLPDDYVQLYNKIQNLEFEYLNQFAKINEEYTANYQEYLLNQSGNNEIIETNSELYGPFAKMQEFNENIIKNTNQAYKDTIAKSKVTRDDLKKETQKSVEKQNRIINV